MAPIIKSKPTVYKNIRFRSRLEAKWAYVLDRLGWSWLYEPFELDGYIPDFIVTFPRGQQLLIEVKPLTGPNTVIQYEAEQKIAESGWASDIDALEAVNPGASLIVGCGPNLDPDHLNNFYRQVIPSLGWVQDFGWGVDGYGPCYISRCPHCDRAFYWNLETLWVCQHCREHTDKPYYLKRHVDLARVWADAMNLFQWQPT